MPEIDVSKSAFPDTATPDKQLANGLADNGDPNSNRAQLIRLIRELEPGHRLTDDGDKVMLDVVRQLIFHTVWLAEELRVAQEEIDRLSEGH